MKKRKTIRCGSRSCRRGSLRHRVAMRCCATREVGRDELSSGRISARWRSSISSSGSLRSAAAASPGAACATPTSPMCCSAAAISPLPIFAAARGSASPSSTAASRGRSVRRRDARRRVRATEGRGDVALRQPLSGRAFRAGDAARCGVRGVSRRTARVRALRPRACGLLRNKAGRRLAGGVGDRRHTRDGDRVARASGGCGSTVRRRSTSRRCSAWRSRRCRSGFGPAGCLAPERLRVRRGFAGRRILWRRSAGKRRSSGGASGCSGFRSEALPGGRAVSEARLCGSVSGSLLGCRASTALRRRRSFVGRMIHPAGVGSGQG